MTLSNLKQELLRQRLAQAGLGTSTTSRATERPRRDEGRDGPVGVSYAQARMWYHSQLASGSAAYNFCLVLKVCGTTGLSGEAMTSAIEQVARRHEILRTLYRSDGGAPRQVVHGELPPRVTEVDLGAAAAGVADDFAERLDRLACEARDEAFDLETDPPLRAVLVRRGSALAAVILVLPHIAGDGGSFGTVLADLEHAYGSGNGVLPPPPEIRYTDYAAWEAQRLGDPTVPDSLHARQLRFWEAELAGLPVDLKLPFDRPRPAAASFAGRQVRRWLGPGLAKALRDTAKRHGATALVVLQAAVATALNRVGAGLDIPLGTPVDLRQDPALDQLVGFFSNTVVVRTDLAGDPSFSDLLRRVQNAMLGALDHRDVPFETLVGHINPPRAASRNPLFGVLVTATRPWPSLRLDGIAVDAWEPRQTQAKFDLTFVAHDEGGDGRIGVSLLYACDLFDEGTARHVLEMTIGILGQGVHHPQLRLSQFAEFGHRRLDDPSAALAGALAARVVAAPVATRTIRLRDGAGTADVVAALGRLLERHEALRFRADPRSGRWTIADAAELWDGPILEDACSNATDIGRFVACLRSPTADAKSEPMLELRAPGPWVDEESWGVLLADLGAIRRGGSPVAQRVGASYVDWLDRTASLTAGGDLLDRVEAWLDLFDDVAERATDGRDAAPERPPGTTERSVAMPAVGPWPDAVAIRTAAVAALLWSLRPSTPLLVDIDEPDRDRMRAGDAVVGLCRRSFPILAASWPDMVAGKERGPIDPGALVRAARAALTLGGQSLTGDAAASFMLARDVSAEAAGAFDHAPTPDLTLSIAVTDPGDSGDAPPPGANTGVERWAVSVEPRNRLTRLTLHARRGASERDDLADAWSAAFTLCLAAAADVAGAAGKDEDLVALSGWDRRRLEETFGPLRDVLPLSPLQEGLRFHAVGKGEGARDVYISQTSLDVVGRIEPELLRRAVERAVERVPTVTAGFAEVSGTMVQVVPGRAEVPWRFEEASGADVAARVADEEYDAPFDAARPPLIRFALLRLPGEEPIYRLLLTAHHILLDGWSIRLMFRLIFRLYEAGVDAAVPTPPPFRRYLGWLGSKDMSEAEEAWRGLLAGIKPTLLHPARQVLSARAERVDERTGTVGSALSGELSLLARSAATTVSTVLELAWGTLLVRMTGETDVVFGNVVSGRPAEVEGVDEIIGLLFNTIPTRVTVGATDTVRSALRALHLRKAASLQHSHVHLAHLHRLAGHGALFDTLFAVQNLPMLDLDADNGVRLADAHVRDATHYPLSMAVNPTSASVDLRLMFRGDVVAPEQAEALVAAYVRILGEFARQPDAPLLTIDALPAGDPLLPPSVSGDTFDVGTLSVSDLLVRQAQATPEVRAVVAGEARLSFAELSASANRLAHLLRAHGVEPECRVALLLPRSEVMIVALFGVFAAHAAYVPIDPETPSNRIASILRQSEPTVVLTVRGLRPLLPKGQGLPAVVVLDDPEVGQALGRQPGTCPEVERPAALQHLAYVIFTSGSTGEPKGVETNYLGLTNMFLNHQKEIFAPTLASQGGRRLRIAHTTSFAFDASWEQLLWLLSGHEVHVIDDETRRDPNRLLALFDREGIDAFDVTPTYGKYLVDHGLLDRDRPSGRPGTGVVFVSLGGEAVGDALWTRLRDAPGVGSYNLYGPTEYTINALGADLADSSEPSVGRPIANTDALILGPGLLPTPVGVAGELYLGGVGLARGYVKRPAGTSERFVANPFGPPGSRLYRTGDLARWRSDGGIDFLGRSDDQIKIRGYRIEPAEVENALVALPGVKRAAVLGRPAGDGSLRLVAYAVCEPSTANGEAIRDALRMHLPAYMVPATIVFVDDLPRTINGKLDVAALPEPAAEEAVTAPPVDDAERAICAAFATVLDRTSIGRFDDFFDCGGHSLLTVRLVGLLRETLGPGIGVRRIYDHPTPAGLAASLAKDGGTGATDPSVTQGADEREVAMMMRDLALPTDLAASQSANRPRATRASPGAVLLTGAAGFLGTHVLAELLKETSATIHVLVRAAGEDAAVARVRAALVTYGLWEDSFDRRLVGVPGDLAQKDFGLSAARFEALAQACDAIVHNGGATNEAEAYARLAATNVGGAKGVLRLASRRMTPIHFVSTASVVARRGVNPAVIGENTRLKAHEVESSGYVRTKWVAEELMHAAAERGLPVTIYRPGRISGHSITGACGGGVGFWYFIRSMLLLEAAPGLRSDRLTLAPVDYIARAVVALMIHGTPGATYHLSNRTQTSIGAILDAARRAGYRLDVVPFDLWRQRLSQAAHERSASGDDSLAPVLLLSDHIGKYDGPAIESALGQENVEAALSGTGIAPSPVTDAMLDRYLRYFIEVGFLPPPPQP